MCGTDIMHLYTEGAVLHARPHTRAGAGFESDKSSRALTCSVWIDPSCSTNGLSHDHDTLFVSGPGLVKVLRVLMSLSTLTVDLSSVSFTCNFVVAATANGAARATADGP